MVNLWRTKRACFYAVVEGCVKGLNVIMACRKKIFIVQGWLKVAVPKLCCTECKGCAQSCTKCTDISVFCLCRILSNCFYVVERNGNSRVLRIVTAANKPCLESHMYI